MFLSVLQESDSTLLLKLLTHHQQKADHFIFEFTQQYHPQLNAYIQSLHNQLISEQRLKRNSTTAHNPLCLSFFQKTENSNAANDASAHITPIEQTLSDLNILYDDFVEYCIENFSEDLLNTLRCPISSAIFKEPVLFKGVVYEKSAFNKQFPGEKSYRSHMVEDMIICMIEEMHSIIQDKASFSRGPQA